MRKFQYNVCRSTVASIEYIGVIITTSLSFAGWASVLGDLVVTFPTKICGHEFISKSKGLQT